MSDDLRNIFKTLSHSSDKWDPYFDVYEQHFSRFRGESITLIEVGVHRGGSLEMWSKYLGPQAKIIGIDVEPAYLTHKYEQDNIQIIQGNQCDPNFWDSFLSEHDNIKIFIDDGLHLPVCQAVTFEKVFPKMPIGSVFLSEDCHTSYDKNIISQDVNNNLSFIEYSKNYADILNMFWMSEHPDHMKNMYEISKGLTGLYFYDSIVVFEKLGKKPMLRVFPDNPDNPDNQNKNEWHYTVN